MEDSEKEAGYFSIEDAIQLTGLKPVILGEICRNAKIKGLAYLSKEKKWMVHSSIIDDLRVILSGNKDSKPIKEK
ncbi:MAG: hypothetical protein M0R32_12100 [Candidatus Cloacimonetes bacterium]|jgi:hypothetical protein|nr:hypothetical protein [Candidatus Cloacimonadota bacterium]